MTVGDRWNTNYGAQPTEAQRAHKLPAGADFIMWSPASEGWDAEVGTLVVCHPKKIPYLVFPDGHTEDVTFEEVEETQ